MNNQFKQVEEKAYQKYLSRGCEHGHDQQDWYEAESEIINQPEKKVTKRKTTKKKKA